MNNIKLLSSAAFAPKVVIHLVNAKCHFFRGFALMVALVVANLGEVAADCTGFDVEVHATSEYGTTYRLYATFDDPGDWVSSVYGLTGSEGNLPMSLLATGGASIYQTNNDFGLNPDFSTDVIPLFESFIPDLYHDSWLTIGAENNTMSGPSSSGMVEALATFNAGVGFENCGGAWYVASTSGPDLHWTSGPQGRVLLAQITMTNDQNGNPGHFAFQLNIQWKDASGATSYFEGASLSSDEFLLSSAGCTDSTACNYDPEAILDDGSCEYFSCVTLGCMDAVACNYNPEADYSDGSCTYPEPGLNCNGECAEDADGDGVCDANEVLGCQDEAACDFNALATDAADCLDYPDYGYDCDGECVLDEDANGVCDLQEVPGCTDEAACNYEEGATQDNGSCAYPEPLLDCSGACLNDADADQICDENEIPGCSDPDALNFNAEATDPGDCVYPEPAPAAFAFTPTATSGLLLAQVTLDGLAATAADWIAGFDEDGNCVGAAQVLVEGGLAYAQVVLYGDDATTAGTDEGMNGGEAFTLQLYDASNASFHIYYDELGVEELTGWSNTNGAPMPGYNDPSVVYAFFSSPYEPACLDVTACNFDPTSLSSTNCIYPVTGLDCEGNCLADNDGDGVCDANEIPGCQDSEACNFNATATDEDGSCIYPADGYNCAGDCLVDSDGDGVCDPFEVVGCMDSSACNYDSSATDAGECVYPPAYFDCGPNCLSDIDGDGVCDELEVAGCTNPDACNFNDQATDDDGSCTLPDTGYDCTGECLSDSDGDGVCDANEVEGCQDPAACNFNPQATDVGPCFELDALGVCGGNCSADVDADGLCDDTDPCVGTFDACGVCNGPGAVYACGCAELPDGDCDCDGNTLDALGVCGGACLADEDADGICDDIDECIGQTDACGVCNGPGPIYDCGCTPLPAGDCDCDGNALDALGVCGGDCAEDADADGVCDVDEIAGCTDVGACNFDPAATDEDGSCAYAAEHYACAGACLEDEDGDGVCDPFEVEGCTDAAAMNFNPDATDDNGLCLYPQAPPPSFDFSGTPASGTMFGQATIDGVAASGFDWIAAFDASGNCAGSAPLLNYGGVAYINLTIYGDDATTAGVDEGMTGTEPFYLVLWDESASTTIYFSDANGPSAIAGWANTNGSPIPGLNDAQTVYNFSTANYEPNCDDPQACNFDPSATIDVGCWYPEAGYDCAGDCLVDSDGDGVCEPFEVFGCTHPQACNFASVATEDDGSCTFAAQGYDCSGTCLLDADEDGICDPFEIPGCTDAAACNFNALATDDNGSCTYSTDVIDCAGNCWEDDDGDGVCNVNEIPGCTDVTACNFAVAATEEDGSCAYAAFGYDCDGDCLSDVDEDGICDVFEGCTDAAACNFSDIAIEDDGSCTYPAPGLDCTGACLNDADGDGVCDADEVPGCTYPTACNYLAAATDDNGSCLFTPPGYTCQMQCISDIDGDGICDADEIPGCTSPDAINYGPYATDDDGTCQFETCASDLDGDGVVNIGDLLSLLSEFQTICE